MQCFRLACCLLLPTPPPHSGDALMDTHAFTYFVKRTFRKYTPGGQAPNPSLLRSIFTTWLYSLRYDTEDDFLQQIKASSAKWKAHSERVAGAVYNKEQVYQKREFALLLSFCEEYAVRHAYDRPDEAEVEEKQDENEEEKEVPIDPVPSPRQNRQTRKRRRSDDGVSSEQTFTVEKLIRIRGGAGTQQVLVQWEGYRRPTWEPYDSIQQQLPKLLVELEASLAAEKRAGEQQDSAEDDTTMRNFLAHFIAEHHVDHKFRWVPDRLNQLEYAAACWVPPHPRNCRPAETRHRQHRPISRRRTHDQRTRIGALRVTRLFVNQRHHRGVVYTCTHTTVESAEHNSGALGHAIAQPVTGGCSALCLCRMRVCACEIVNQCSHTHVQRH